VNYAALTEAVWCFWIMAATDDIAAIVAFCMIGDYTMQGWRRA
jgi:hypothetical protein